MYSGLSGWLYKQSWLRRQRSQPDIRFNGFQAVIKCTAIAGKIESLKLMGSNLQQFLRLARVAIQQIQLVLGEKYQALIVWQPAWELAQFRQLRSGTQLLV